MSGENTSNRKRKQETISQDELAEQQETHHDKARQQTKETTEQCDHCFKKTQEKAQARRAPETTEQCDCHF